MQFSIVIILRLFISHDAVYHSEFRCASAGPDSLAFSDLSVLVWTYGIPTLPFPVHGSWNPGLYTYLPNPSVWSAYDTRSIFKRSSTGLNSEFSFSLTACYTKAKEPSLPNYLPITGERIIGCLLFLRVLILCERQTASSRIWTRFAVSIFYDGNPYISSTYYIQFRLKFPRHNSPIIHKNELIEARFRVGNYARP